MKIRYIEHDSGNELGIVEKTGLKETLLPKYRSDKHNVFINKHFLDKPDKLLWQILNVDLKDREADILIRAEVRTPSSYGENAKKQNKRSTHFIKEYSIVDVDFGHFSTLSDFETEGPSNSKFAGSLMKGELHKKRPCVVLDIDNQWGVAQVIPLTTNSESSTNPNCVKISSSSFENLSFRYREKTSFAMLGMLQTVSSFRIYPPELKSKRYENRAVRLTSSDKEILQNALSKHFSHGSASAIDVLNSRLSNLQREKSRMRTTLNDRKQIIDELKALLVDIGDKAFGFENLEFDKLLLAIKKDLET